MRYWKSRAINNEQLMKERTDETIKKVNALYDDVNTGLTQSAIKILQRYCTWHNLTVDNALKLLNEKQTKEYIEQLLETLKEVTDVQKKAEIMAKINAPAYAARISRIQAMQNLIIAEAYSVGYKSSKLTEIRLINEYKQSYYQEHYTIQHGTGLAYDFSKISNHDVKAAIQTEWKGGNYSKRIWKDTEKLAKVLEDTITQGLMTGMTFTEMEEIFDKKIHSSRNNINRIIRTETAFCASKGREEAIKDAGIDKYIFIATLDLRTSTICRALDNKVFLVKDAEIGKNKPPMHPNCRSTDGAYIDGKNRKELKRRARNPITGENELVPQNMSYAEWYKKYVVKNRNSMRARANEEAIKKYGIKNPYNLTDEELKQRIKHNT